MKSLSDGLTATQSVVARRIWTVAQTPSSKNLYPTRNVLLSVSNWGKSKGSFSPVSRGPLIKSEAIGRRGLSWELWSKTSVRHTKTRQSTFVPLTFRLSPTLGEFGSSLLVDCNILLSRGESLSVSVFNAVFGSTFPDADLERSLDTLDVGVLDLFKNDKSRKKLPEFWPLSTKFIHSMIN